MASVNQVLINNSFITVEESTSLAKVTSELSNYDFVVVTASTFYVIQKDERYLLTGHDEASSIKKIIADTNWPSSSTSTLANLQANTNWNRPVLIQAENQETIIGLVTPSQWITHLHSQNEILASYFDTLAETINDAVTAVDNEGNVILWNTAAEHTYKIQRDDIIGRKIGEHFKDESIILHTILNEGRPVRGTYHRPNEQTHVLINASPIIRKNRVIGGVATEHDITNIVRLNEEIDVSLLIPKDNPFSSFAGISPEIKQAVDIAKKVASTDMPILLTGEPGSGKEMLAQAIHYGGSKHKEPFLSLNCATIPSGLLEIELFGHQKDVFSEDPTTIAGKLEQAHNGTLFIEEIDKMPLEIQVKFLRYLEERSFYHVGGKEEIQVQTRIVASTTTPLEELLKAGEFHENLYYLLTVINIIIPPLRDHKEDIEALTQQFVKEFSKKYKKKAPFISSEVLEAFMQYDWPGNIRELRNTIERMIFLSDQSLITVAHLPDNLKDASSFTEVQQEEDSLQEARLIEETLQKTYGNKSAAADLLGISRGTLYNKIKEYGLN
ncbi:MULTISPECIES: sigma-54 interaction domain-containing protein [Priestia]|uniref:sigma-54 interaction domain-containing protein n=1 Tax=Priestia TaxID=2800373 RepID=UPI0021F40A77|nr:sigma 54-interacting transcriptional regulator [Priestia megaterium]UYP08256.1 sigma 54-interacting transcriptional regulator [Priestia megaterium]